MINVQTLPPIQDEIFIVDDFIEAVPDLFLDGKSMESIRYVIALDSGEIVRGGACPAEAVFAQVANNAERAFMIPKSHAFVNNDTYKVDFADPEAPALVLRTSIPFTINKSIVDASGDDEVILTGIPSGTVMSVLNQSETESGGQLVFSVDLAGEYELTLSHPLCLDATIMVTAV